MRILAIDIGGTSAKVLIQGQATRKIASGPEFTPQRLLDELRQVVHESTFDAVAMGYPGKVVDGQPARDPYNLGPGWLGFDFASHFSKPLRIMNDAAMQALGSYTGGRMLFLGLGTSVGSTLIVDNVVVPLELGSVPHAFGKTLEHLLAKQGLAKLGKRNGGTAPVLDAIPRLQDAFMADYTVLGGGNAKRLQRKMPATVRLGSNRYALRGGCRLFECRCLGTTHEWSGEKAEGEKPERGKPERGKPEREMGRGGDGESVGAASNLNLTTSN